jgi:uncharacterized protein
MGPFFSFSIMTRTEHIITTGDPSPNVRVLIIPGLNGSGPLHWQSWLETQYSDPARVHQVDWQTPDLNKWSDAIANTIRKSSPNTAWIAVAHSFGCLALANLLIRESHKASSYAPSVASQIASALLVAPADPFKFNVAKQVDGHTLKIPSTLIASETDPWMSFEKARHWSQTWGCQFENLGNAGHINVDAGFGPWPLVRVKVDQLIRQQQRTHRLGTPQAWPANPPFFAAEQTPPTTPYFTPKGTHHGQSALGRYRP